MHVIKYEDFRYRTEETLREFCDYIKIMFSDEFIQKPKEKKFFKQLPNAPDRHFMGVENRGGKGTLQRKH